jgi:hypothetical protein
LRASFATFAEDWDSPEEEAVFAIPEGEILEGQLKANKVKLVQAWIELRQDELMADWELASQGEAVFKIDPLR